MSHRAQPRLMFKPFVVMGPYHIAQASVELLGSKDPPASASQSAGMTSVSHFTGPRDSDLIVLGRDLDFGIFQCSSVDSNM